MDAVRRIVYTVPSALSLLAAGAMARDVCDVYGATYTYCDDGYHCCDHNTRCCVDSISGGVVAAIVLGSVFGLIVLAVLIWALANKCKYKPRRVVQPTRPQPVSTVSQGGIYSRTPPQPPAYSQHDQLGQPPPMSYPGGAVYYGQSPPTSYPGGSAFNGYAPPPDEKPPPYSQIYSTTNSSGQTS